SRLAEDGDEPRAVAILRALADRHLSVASAMTTDSRGRIVAEVQKEFEDLIGLVRALTALREVSPRSHDAVLAVGEIVSSRMVAAALTDHRVPATWFDARRILVTDAEHTGAAPDMIETEERAREHLAPALAAGQVAVLGGFIGSAANGATTTLGRGGSDYSA